MKVLFHKTKYTVWKWGERSKWIGRQNRQTCWIYKTLITAYRKWQKVSTTPCIFALPINKDIFPLISKLNLIWLKINVSDEIYHLNLLRITILFITLNTAYWAMLKRLKSSSRWQHWSNDTGYASVALVGASSLWGCQTVAMHCGRKKMLNLKSFSFFLNAEKGIGFDCHRNILFSCFSFSL